MHLVSAARENDPFYQSKYRTFMPSFFSKNIITHIIQLDLRSRHIKQLICK